MNVRYILTTNRAYCWWATRSKVCEGLSHIKTVADRYIHAAYHIITEYCFAVQEQIGLPCYPWYA